MHGNVQHLNPAGLHKNPAYTQAVVVSGNATTIYVGGQNAVDASGNIVGKGDIRAQTEKVLKNLETALEAGGAELQHVVKWNVYILHGQSAQAGFEAFQQVWWLVAISPLALYVIVALVLRLMQGQWLDLSLLGQVDFLPNLGWGALFLWLFTYGIGEETGWRGYALPRLQKKRSALSATFILWVFWATWHLPAFFYLYDSAIVIGFLFGVLAGAIVFTWLYNSTGGGIFMVALFHGVFNFTTGCTACKAGMISAIISTLIMVWAVIVVILFKPTNLSHAEKQVTQFALEP